MLVIGGNDETGHTLQFAFENHEPFATQSRQVLAQSELPNDARLVGGSDHQSRDTRGFAETGSNPDEALGCELQLETDGIGSCARCLEPHGPEVATIRRV